MSVVDLLGWVVAVLVLVLVLWLASHVVKVRFFDKNLTIAPFHVTGRDDADGQLARSLALMLQGRVRQIQGRFETAQKDLFSSEDPGAEAVVDPRVSMPPLTMRSITMSTMVLAESPAIDVKVAGVEFGGIAAWLGRSAARRRTLTFAVHFGADEALVIANLEALPAAPTKDLWLRTEAEPGAVVTAIAYALLQAGITQAMEEGGATTDGSTAIRALDLNEFHAFVTSLPVIAEWNRGVAPGHDRAARDLRDALSRLTPLVDKVPRWLELTHLVAQIAERTGDLALALDLYARLQKADRAQPRLEARVRAVIDSRLEALGGAVQASPPDSLEALIHAVRDYEKRLGFGPPHVEVELQSGSSPAPTAALWNDELRRFEVDLKVASELDFELARYTALMGRFMALHFGRCKDSLQVDFWNPFRYSVVFYLISTEPDTTFTNPDPHYPLFDTLTEIGRVSGVEAARRLALRLLDRYECDWGVRNLPDKLAAVGAEIDVPEEVIRQAAATTLTRPH